MQIHYLQRYYVKENVETSNVGGIIVEYIEQVHAFAEKWLEKFRNQKIDYTELVDHYLADDCEALGFQMDCGKAFSDQYGSAASNYNELNKVIDEVTDIQLLGSAVYSRWRYFNHWAYDAAAILKFENRSWFLLALGRMLVLSGENTLIFAGVLKKIHIVSNRVGYEFWPGPDEEIEQHITIHADGSVLFEAFAFGNKYDGKNKRIRTENRQLSLNTAEQMMSAFSRYFGNEYTEVFATDIGDWHMELTNEEGKIYRFKGSLCAHFKVDGMDLSDLVRENLEMPDLYMFDGNEKSDPVDRIEIFYHRITKIKQKNPLSEHVPFAVWDYTESLVIDRNSESIEHEQNIGTGCILTRKYKIEGGVKELLDDLDSDTIFSHTEGNPENAVYDPYESRDYTIKVTMENGMERKIEGTYDKKGLPDDWADFIERVYEFITFYGMGEIMSPFVYNKVCRCDTDIIYCSVAFEKGYKCYYYISDDDAIEVGDFVVVPAGRDNHEAVVCVKKKEYFSKEEAPLPVEKTKHIIRKCSEEEINKVVLNDF